MQLINAVDFYVDQKPKSLGNKRKFIDDDSISKIVDLYKAFDKADNEYSKIFDVSDFGYTKVTVECPLYDKNGEKVLKKGHLGVIENYIGHGIGKTMHEAPEVPNYGKKGHGYKLVEGDTICIEPMSCLGKPANYIDKDDNWTVKMKDGSIGCHCEHTVLVTHDGYEVLTLC